MTAGAIRHAKLQSNHHHQQTNIKFFTGRMPFLSPNQQCQSTEGKISRLTDCLTSLEMLLVCYSEVVLCCQTRTRSSREGLRCHAVQSWLEAQPPPVVACWLPSHWRPTWTQSHLVDVSCSAGAETFGQKWCRVHTDAGKSWNLTRWPHPPFWVRCGCPC